MDDVYKNLYYAKKDEAEARSLQQEAASHNDNPRLQQELREAASAMENEASDYRQAADEAEAAESGEE